MDKAISTNIQIIGGRCPFTMFAKAVPFPLCVRSNLITQLLNGPIKPYCLRIFTTAHGLCCCYYCCGCCKTSTITAYTFRIIAFPNATLTGTSHSQSKNKLLSNVVVVIGNGSCTPSKLLLSQVGREVGTFARRLLIRKRLESSNKCDKKG